LWNGDRLRASPFVFKRRLLHLKPTHRRIKKEETGYIGFSFVACPPTAGRLPISPLPAALLPLFNTPQHYKAYTKITALPNYIQLFLSIAP
jgi:hypothetical protein